MYYDIFMKLECVCNIESHEEHRIKIDLMWMYKILLNLMCIN